ncbi:MAG: hypothetical protein WEC33_06235, partial [Dehalococcoidia bacterium]
LFPAEQLEQSNGRVQSFNPTGEDRLFPPGTIYDPAIEQLIPDGQGSVWVLTEYPGARPGVYGALYHFTP